ncbi:MAG: peptidylprolyl isomerase [Gammaproteobacteria bacterium]|nr:peptidylprolyl isomerase [Gammaproteobacteria bacterium]
MQDRKDRVSVSKVNKAGWLRIEGLVVSLGLLVILAVSGNSQAQVNPEHIRTVVRISTNVGDISVGLYDDATPLTVANFLGYVERGDYNQTYIHRTENVSIGGDFIVVQGGGYRFTPFLGPVEVPEQDPVLNEPVFSNLRGTIAMAKFADDPNSATSEWYFNLSDNSANLDDQNGGFAVFGEVLGGEDGMATLDAIMALQKVDLGPRANFAPIVTGSYEGRPDEEFVFVNMEVVDRFSSSVNVYEANRGLLIASVNVDNGSEVYSLNFSIFDEDTIEANGDSVLKLVSAPEAAATFDSSTGRLFFSSIEFSTVQAAFTCTNAEFELESTNPYRFTLVSFDPC